MDNVNHPKHYATDKIECIDAMVSTFGARRVADYCLINAFKYIWRCPFKGKLEEDREKAMWYLRKAEELNESHKTEWY